MASPFVWKLRARRTEQRNNARRERRRQRRLERSIIGRRERTGKPTLSKRRGTGTSYTTAVPAIAVLGRRQEKQRLRSGLFSLDNCACILVFEAEILL
jgi:hypothetical protein